MKVKVQVKVKGRRGGSRGCVLSFVLVRGVGTTLRRTPLLGWTVMSNFGQSVFGHRVLPANFGQSVFGQSVFDQSVFDQSVWANPF